VAPALLTSTDARKSAARAGRSGPRRTLRRADQRRAGAPARGTCGRERLAGGRAALCARNVARHAQVPRAAVVGAGGARQRGGGGARRLEVAAARGAAGARRARRRTRENVSKRRRALAGVALLSSEQRPTCVRCAWGSGARLACTMCPHRRHPPSSDVAAARRRGWPALQRQHGGVCASACILLHLLPRSPAPSSAAPERAGATLNASHRGRTSTLRLAHPPAPGLHTRRARCPARPPSPPPAGPAAAPCPPLSHPGSQTWRTSHGPCGHGRCCKKRATYRFVPLCSVPPSPKKRTHPQTVWATSSYKMGVS
jgi:hypothetical protein